MKSQYYNIPVGTATLSGGLVKRCIDSGGLWRGFITFVLKITILYK